MLAYYHAEKYGSMGYEDVNSFQCAKDNKVDASAIADFLSIQKKAYQQQRRMTEKRKI